MCEEQSTFFPGILHCHRIISWPFPSGIGAYLAEKPGGWSRLQADRSMARRFRAMAEELDRGGEGATVTTGSAGVPAEDDEATGGEEGAASVLSPLFIAPLEVGTAAGAADELVVDILYEKEEKQGLHTGTLDGSRVESHWGPCVNG